MGIRISLILLMCLLFSCVDRSPGLVYYVGSEGYFNLGEPISAAREVDFYPFTKSSKAFYIDQPRYSTFALPNVFVGNVDRGGSCNVDYLHYCPHSITHLESSAHVLSTNDQTVYSNDIAIQKLQGLAYIIDLTSINTIRDYEICLGDVEGKLDLIDRPISMLGLKTKSSELEEHYDFSGKSFMFLQDSLAGILASRNFEGQNLDVLLLDLPSIDPEDDDGKLLAHRAWFGIPSSGTIGIDTAKRALVELAYFAEIEEGYYYVNITPPNFATNAVSTGLTLSPLIKR